MSPGDGYDRTVKKMMFQLKTVHPAQPINSPKSLLGAIPKTSESPFHPFIAQKAHPTLQTRKLIPLNRQIILLAHPAYTA